MAVKFNPNYKNLVPSYLFSDIAKRVKAFAEQNPNAELIRLGIGDVRGPLPAACIDAGIKALEEQKNPGTFRGYGPEPGYEFLRAAIAADYKSVGVDLDVDEIFVSDGAKSDVGNFGDILSADNIVALQDPVYPVYKDTNIMAGRKIITLPCTAENNFIPELPKERADMIYLCYPNNPTGTVLTRAQLKEWVAWANKNKSLILFDSAYEAFITNPDVPHSIYEIEGAKDCAVEFRSFSKTAGFTGTRCAYTVVPKNIVMDGASLNAMWNRRQSTKFNGVPYVVQRMAEACFTEEGRRETALIIKDYQANARIIKSGLASVGLSVFGGDNAPYVWMKTPNGMPSWEFFDVLLNKANVVGTPGAGFGDAGEGYLRLTAFNTLENTERAIERIKKLPI